MSEKITIGGQIYPEDLAAVQQVFELVVDALVRRGCER